MSSTGTTTCSSSGLRAPASMIETSRPSPIPPRNRAIVSSGRWVALRPIRWSGSRLLAVAAPLSRAGARGVPGVSARCAPRFVPGDGVDLVDDHVLDAAQDLARLAREQEVQALGRRDEDVRRVADEVAPLVRRACRRSGWRSRSAAAPRPAAAPRARCRRAGRGGCARRRRSAPSAGRRRGCGRCRVRPSWASGSARGRGGRGTTGTRRGSCRCRSGRGSACARPRLIAAQPSAWAFVGASNVASNQARTAGPNGARGSTVRATTGRRV